ncbi:ABC transporter substrate-binding protein [Streptomyces sp. NPDC049577]|uniref:ABC transporter substrate-binding protein n=1 Tax=Streptomyces sp. NPDC049577 TaxID=3155153 RepID=UPI003416F67F
MLRYVVERPEPARRAFLTACALGVLTAGCGVPGHAPEAAGSGPGGGWAFTDDTGRTVTLARRPRRVVAYSTAVAALWDYGIRPVGVYGPLRARGGGRDDTVLGEADARRMTTLGGIWGQIDVERLGRLAPDLIVDPLQYGAHQIEPGGLDQVRRLAPVLSIEVYGAEVATSVRRYADLARALGAPAATVDRQAAAYRAARRRAERTAAARPGLRVMFVSADRNGLRVSKAGFPSVADFASLGLDVVLPRGGETAYVEKLSWELADRYPADLILLDVRSSSLQPPELRHNAMWRDLPAVRAGRLGRWNPEPCLSHRGMTRVYDAFTRDVAAARPLPRR